MAKKEKNAPEVEEAAAKVEAASAEEEVTAKKAKKGFSLQSKIQGLNSLCTKL